MDEIVGEDQRVGALHWIDHSAVPTNDLDGSAQWNADVLGSTDSRLQRDINVLREREKRLVRCSPLDRWMKISSGRKAPLWESSDPY